MYWFLLSFLFAAAARMVAPAASLSAAVSTLAFGFFLGLKHATDADHIVAVSTIVSEKKSARAASLIGALWGVGHTLALFLVGAVVLVLKTQIPEHVATFFEFGVGVMLVFLGLRLFYHLLRGSKLHIHVHDHNGVRHAHFHLHKKDEPHLHHSHHGLEFDRRSLFIGLVHGMAGSAALMLLVLTTISSTWLAVGYILIFGVGSIGGMMLMSMLLALPITFLGQRFDRFQKSVQVAAGALSVAFGILIMWEMGQALWPAIS